MDPWRFHTTSHRIWKDFWWSFLQIDLWAGNNDTSFWKIVNWNTTSRTRQKTWKYHWVSLILITSNAHVKSWTIKKMCSSKLKSKVSRIVTLFLKRKLRLSALTGKPKSIDTFRIVKGTKIIKMRKVRTIRGASITRVSNSSSKRLTLVTFYSFKEVLAPPTWLEL